MINHQKKCYITLGISYIIHTFGSESDDINMATCRQVNIFKALFITKMHIAGRNNFKNSKKQIRVQFWIVP